MLYTSTALAVALLAGMWVRSAFRMDLIERGYGYYAPPVNPNAPAETDLSGCWTYHARGVSLMSWDSAVSFGFSEYVSYAPRREELDSWADFPRWDAVSMPMRGPLSDESIAVYDGPLNWRVWRLGFQQSARQGTTAQAVLVPYPVLMFLIAIPAWIAWRRDRRRARHIARGQCVRCGYDCRGATRCPECGRAVEPGPIVAQAK